MAKSILDHDKPGAFKFELNGRKITFRLRLGEIERFDDAHGANGRGILAVFQDFQSDNRSPSLQEVKDLVALAMVGGGEIDEPEAQKIVDKMESTDILRYQQIAQYAVLLGLSNYDDIVLAENEDDDDDGGKKKAK